MAKVEVHAGDWVKGGQHQFSFGSFSLMKPGAWFHENVPASRLTSLEIATEANVKRLGGTLGWGAVGAIALGPLGLLAGLVAGGNGKNVTFIATFDDGRSMLATTDAKAFTKMQAEIFGKGSVGISAAPPSASVTLPSPDPWTEVRSIERRVANAKAEGLSVLVVDHYEKLLRDGEEDDAERFLCDALQARR